MGDKSCIIILGLNELASAVGRRLLLAGHAVAMHAAAAPVVLRRRMAFSDAWYDGVAALEGVEAHRTGSDAAFIAGLRSGMLIPVLTQGSLAAVARWPWDVLIDGRENPEASSRAEIEAELSIVLGPGAEAGADCDLVIETGGNDPGAVLRSGSARSRPTNDLDRPVAAPASGLLHTEAGIGDRVAAGAVLGFVGSVPVPAPAAGRVRGLLRPGGRAGTGETVAEIITDPHAPVDGISRAHQAIARSVEFTIDMEQQGRSFDVWSRRTGFRKW